MWTRRPNPNKALERTAAPLLRSTVAGLRPRVVRSTAPVGGGRSAWALICHDEHP